MRLFCLILASLALPAAEQVDWIVAARFVVPMDSSRRVIENGAVAVRGNAVMAAGPRAEILRAFKARKTIDRGEAIIMPGLVNTHTHAPMSLLRGIADDRRLQDWLEKYIFPAEGKNVNRDFVKWGTLLACAEMMRAGTTLYTDMYYFEDTMAEATKQCGMRGVLGQTIIGFPAPDYKTPAEALAGARAFIERFRSDPLIVPAVAPHAIYTNSAATLQAAAKLADEYSVPLIIHVSETKKENDDALAAHKRSPTAYLDSLNALARRTLFAHAVWTDAGDWAIMARRKIGVAHCPSSNMKLSSGAAPVQRMREAGVAVGLGPDGPAGSNNDFDMLEEVDLAAKLSKVTTMDPQSLPARDVVAMATIEGARALQMDGIIGSLEPGKRADLITIQLDQPRALPYSDVYAMLAYSLKGSDVRDVMIDGKWTVLDHQFKTLNWLEIAANAKRLRAQVEASIR